MAAGNLHECAVQAEEYLEQLATGLAQSGATPDVVRTVTQMASVVRQIVKALGKGQESTGDEEPPERPQPRNTAEATEQLHAEVQAKAAERAED